MDPEILGMVGIASLVFKHLEKSSGGRISYHLKRKGSGKIFLLVLLYGALDSKPTD